LWLLLLPQVVFVLNADDSGCIKTPIPGTPGGPVLQRSIDWLLVDGMQVRKGTVMLAALPAT
jgi:hypothetical protein